MTSTPQNYLAKTRPHCAMILAAGEGRRMQPLTGQKPKPLLLLAGEPIIDHVLRTLVAFGISRVVVNLHHLGGALRAHLSGRMDLEIIFSDESDGLLDSGGGIAKALPLLGSAPFIVMNGDAPIFDVPILDGEAAEDGPSSLERLADAFDSARTDALLLLHKTAAVPDYDGPGDYQIEAEGRLVRQPRELPADYVFTGTQILSPALFEPVDTLPPGAFSSVELFDRAERAGRLYGLEHRGLWLQMNTVEGLAQANRELGKWQS